MPMYIHMYVKLQVYIHNCLKFQNCTDTAFTSLSFSHSNITSKYGYYNDVYVASYYSDSLQIIIINYLATTYKPITKAYIITVGV